MDTILNNDKSRNMSGCVKILVDFVLLAVEELFRYYEKQTTGDNRSSLSFMYLWAVVEFP